MLYILFLLSVLQQLSLEDITTYANIYNDPKKETIFKSLKVDYSLS